MNCPSAIRKFILCEIMKSQLSQNFHNSSHAAPKMPWQWLVLWWIWPMTITQAARGDCWRPLETCQFLMVKFEFQLFLNFCRRCKSFTCSFDLEKHMQKHAKLYEKQIKSTIWSYALWISLSIFEYLWVGMLQGPCAKWVASGHAPGPKDGGSHLNEYPAQIIPIWYIWVRDTPVYGFLIGENYGKRI